MGSNVAVESGYGFARRIRQHKVVIGMLLGAIILAAVVGVYFGIDRSTSSLPAAAVGQAQSGGAGAGAAVAGANKGPGASGSTSDAQLQGDLNNINNLAGGLDGSINDVNGSMNDQQPNLSY